jgi:ataxia telangiectasia mutated family protein
MATRISLIRSVRQKEERNQIGNLIAPFTQSLIDVEKHCLVRLSEAARDAHQIQIALNSIVRAQRLEKTASFEVSQEFASVLWLQKEEKLAVQFMKDLVGRDDSNIPDTDRIGNPRKAMLLARLVNFIFLTRKPRFILFRAPGLLKLVLKSQWIS